MWIEHALFWTNETLIRLKYATVYLASLSCVSPILLVVLPDGSHSFWQRRGLAPRLGKDVDPNQTKANQTNPFKNYEIEANVCKPAGWVSECHSWCMFSRFYSPNTSPLRIRCSHIFCLACCPSAHGRASWIWRWSECMWQLPAKMLGKQALQVVLEVWTWACIRTI